MNLPSQKLERRISSRLIRKGALVEETYVAFQHWDLAVSFEENLRHLQDTNIIGAKNERWLHEVATTISSRFKTHAPLEPLVILAKGGFPLGKWKSCMLWHVGAVDELYYRFATEWLFDEFEKGTLFLRTDDVVPFVKSITNGRMAKGAGLSDYGLLRAGRDLLLMASDFGLLTGNVSRQFANHHLDSDSFLYVAHALASTNDNARQIVSSPDWRLFLMRTEDVERELLNLHQYRKVEYHVAGSLAQLKLPDTSWVEYARGLVE